MIDDTLICRPPSYFAYHLRDCEQGFGEVWSRIGAAWAWPNGTGFNVAMHLLPPDGRFMLVLPEAAEKIIAGNAE